MAAADARWTIIIRTQLRREPVSVPLLKTWRTCLFMFIGMHVNPTSENRREQNSKGAQSWYARLSDEKRAEYNQKRRTLYSFHTCQEVPTVRLQAP